MSYPKRLLRLRPTKGLVFDTPAHEVGPEYYTAGQNVIFRDGFAMRQPGYRTDMHDTAITTSGLTDLHHIVNCQFSGTNYWLIFDDNECYSIESTNAVDQTLYGGLTAVTQPWQYSSALLNGIPIITNGSDELLYWDGSSALQALTDWTATESCKSVAVFKYHIFALDIDGPSGTFPSLVKWSDAAEPGTIPSSWTPAATNEAGSVELSDSPGAVLCAVPNRDMLILYKQSAMYGAQYVGGNQVFSFVKLNASTGALNRHAVADLGNGQHFVVTQGDIVLTDGTNVQPVGSSRIKNYLFDTLDSDNYENLFVVYNRAENEVLICFPSTGSSACNSAIVYDIVNDSLGVRSLPDIKHAAMGYVDDTSPSKIWTDQSQTWAAATGVWGASVNQANERLVFAYGSTLEEQDTDDAVSLAASVGKYDLTFDEPERVKFVKRLHVRKKSGAGTLLVRVGSRMTPTDTITWSNEVTLTEDDQIVNTFAQGRYISVEMRSTGSDVWTVTGVDLEAELRGYF